jgi:hypothetical protein
MKPISIWYHTCIQFNREHGLNIIKAQMDALKSSGLLEVCNHFFVGINGNDEDEFAVATLLPDQAVTFQNSPSTWPSGEVPTLMHMRRCLLVSLFPCNVMYHHMKGLSHPPSSGLYSNMSNWRWCMQTHVVERWRECVKSLEDGYEVAGVHWHTPETYPGPGHVPFFAGNFWWAKSEFLCTLPQLEPEKHLAGGRYEAEAWLGRGKRWPKAMDMKHCSVWACNH